MLGRQPPEDQESPVPSTWPPESPPSGIHCAMALGSELGASPQGRGRLCTPARASPAHLGLPGRACHLCSLCLGNTLLSGWLCRAGGTWRQRPWPSALGSGDPSKGLAALGSGGGGLVRVASGHLVYSRGWTPWQGRTPGAEKPAADLTVQCAPLGHHPSCWKGPRPSSHLCSDAGLGPGQQAGPALPWLREPTDEHTSRDSPHRTWLLQRLLRVQTGDSGGHGRSRALGRGEL